MVVCLAMFCWTVCSMLVACFLWCREHERPSCLMGGWPPAERAQHRWLSPVNAVLYKHNFKHYFYIIVLWRIFQQTVTHWNSISCVHHYLCEPLNIVVLPEILFVHSCVVLCLMHARIVLVSAKRQRINQLNHDYFLYNKIK